MQQPICGGRVESLSISSVYIPPAFRFAIACSNEMQLLVKCKINTVCSQKTRQHPLLEQNKHFKHPNSLFTSYFNCASHNIHSLQSVPNSFLLWVRKWWNENIIKVYVHPSTEMRRSGLLFFYCRRINLLGLNLMASLCTGDPLPFVSFGKCFEKYTEFAQNGMFENYIF